MTRLFVIPRFTIVITRLTVHHPPQNSHPELKIVIPGSKLSSWAQNCHPGLKIVIPGSTRDPCLMPASRVAWIADQVRNDSRPHGLRIRFAMTVTRMDRRVATLLAVTKPGSGSGRRIIGPKEELPCRFMSTPVPPVVTGSRPWFDPAASRNARTANPGSLTSSCRYLPPPPPAMRRRPCRVPALDVNTEVDRVPVA